MTNLRCGVWTGLVACWICGGVLAQGKQYCLVVGVEKYRHSRLQPLKFAVDDALALAKVLKDTGFTGTLLTDDTKEPPTKANIERHLHELRTGCKPTDTLVLAFAGHGLQFTGEPDAYFCPIDAIPFPDETETLVSINKIYTELDKSVAGVKVILVDACRNDPDPGRGRGLDAGSVPPPKGVAALFSCSPGQRAYEHDVLGHGVFFHQVLEGLQGKAANERGEVTFSRLAEYVGDTVPDKLKELFPERRDLEQLPNSKTDLIGRSPVLARVTSRPAVPVLPPSSSSPTRPSSPPLTRSTVVREGQTAGELLEVSGLRFRWCPPGRFTMGSPVDEAERQDDESPVEVTLPRGFWLGETEVTQQQWQGVQGSDSAPWGGKDFVRAGDANPAVYISHGLLGDGTVEGASATEYCQKLTVRERSGGRLPEGWSYRLPTEAEWEYACRAGTRTAYSFGADATQLSEYGWWGGLRGDGNAREERYAHAVGQKRPNDWGLRDMHGNVWEWCSDWYGDRLPGGTAPLGSATGWSRVGRGGSWGDSAGGCRSAYRSRGTPDLRGDILGFRLALSPSGE